MYRYTLKQKQHRFSSKSLSFRTFQPHVDSQEHAAVEAGGAQSVARWPATGDVVHRAHRLRLNHVLEPRRRLAPRQRQVRDVLCHKSPHNVPCITVDRRLNKTQREKFCIGRISLHDFNSVLGNTVKLHTNQSKSQASQPVTCRRVERVVLQVEPELVDGVVGVERVALAQVLLLLHQTSVHRRVDAAHVLVDVCVHLMTSEHVVNPCQYVSLQVRRNTFINTF